MAPKTILWTLIIAAAASAAASAQSSSSEPNPVIGRPDTSATPPINPSGQSGGSTSPSSGGGIVNKVEGFLDRVLHRDQSQLTVDQLPQAAQTTVRAQTDSASIQSITPVVSNGQTNYVVSFTRNGQPVNLQVDAFGRIVNGASAPGTVPGSVISTGPAAAGANQTLSSIPDWRTAPIRQPLAEANPIDLRSLPETVRNTLLRYAGPGPINNVLRGTLGGQPVYQADLNPNGQVIALRLAENGALLNDQINDRFLALLSTQQNRWAGNAPVSQTEVGSSNNLEPLGNPRPIPFDQLPLAVQTTISGMLNGGTQNPVVQGIANGRGAYETTYSQNGQRYRLRVAEDGSVLARTEQP